MKLFWEVASLEQLTLAQWEALCDGCAQCCLVKLEDQDTGRIRYTHAACEYLDLHDCRCTVYTSRRRAVKQCRVLTPQNIAQMTWLPRTCAYRCLYEKRPLPVWHPLLTNDPWSVLAAGVSIKGRALSECYIHPRQLQDMIIDIVV